MRIETYPDLTDLPQPCIAPTHRGKGIPATWAYIHDWAGTAYYCTPCAIKRGSNKHAYQGIWQQLSITVEMNTNDDPTAP